MFYRSGPEKDQLEAWQWFYCFCCLVLAPAEEAEAEALAGGSWYSYCMAMVVGGDAGGAGMLAGENGCRVAIYW